MALFLLVRMSTIDQDKLEPVVRPVVESFGCALWGIEFRVYEKSAVLRVFIDKPEGVTLDDCTEVSNQLSAVLDVEDPLAMPYTLEVSSPGIERPLFGVDHYLKYVGQRAKLKLKWPVDGRRNYEGVIEGAEDQRAHLRISEGELKKIPLSTIARGQLKVDLDEYFKGHKR